MKHVLVVEDDAILYLEMKEFLERKFFFVDKFTPSAEEAIQRIGIKTPDIVLLDIRLKGEMTGLDLGDILHKSYKLPFIYVTEFGDDDTFNRGLATSHEYFMVKTKPVLNEQELYRVIQTVLKKHVDSSPLERGIECLVDYRINLKNYSDNQVTRKYIDYNDIAFFTTDSFEKNKKNTLKPNYVWLLTRENTKLYLDRPLKEIATQLPFHFIKISDHAIVNLSTDFFDGRINGNYVSINDRSFIIGRTYKKKLEKRIRIFYRIL